LPKYKQQQQEFKQEPSPIDLNRNGFTQNSTPTKGYSIQLILHSL
jgi:hypothetical protein